MNYRTFSRKIHAACKKWIAEGGKIRPVSSSYTEDGYNGKTCKCPLGALSERYNYPCNKHDLAHVIDMTNDEFAVFVTAFDDAGEEVLRRYPEHARLIGLAQCCRRMYAGC